jgi:hypothetical protein
MKFCLAVLGALALLLPAPTRAQSCSYPVVNYAHTSYLAYFDEVSDDREDVASEPSSYRFPAARNFDRAVWPDDPSKVLGIRIDPIDLRRDVYTTPDGSRIVPTLARLYELTSTTNGVVTDYLYTYSSAMANAAVGSYGYVRQPAFSVWLEHKYQPGTRKLRRFFSPSRVAHFYATNPCDLNAQPGASDWYEEGFEGFVYTTQVPESVPLFRYTRLTSDYAAVLRTGSSPPPADFGSKVLVGYVLPDKPVATFTSLPSRTTLRNRCTRSYYGIPAGPGASCQDESYPNWAEGFYIDDFGRMSTNLGREWRIARSGFVNVAAPAAAAHIGQTTIELSYVMTSPSFFDSGETGHIATWVRSNIDATVFEATVHQGVAVIFGDIRFDPNNPCGRRSAALEYVQAGSQVILCVRDIAGQPVTLDNTTPYLVKVLVALDGTTRITILKPVAGSWAEIGRLRVTAAEITAVARQDRPSFTMDPFQATRALLVVTRARREIEEGSGIFTDHDTNVDLSGLTYRWTAETP